MGRKATGQRQGRVSDQNGESPVSPITVKATLHLSVGTAQRLGVESAMRRISQSAIAEEVSCGLPEPLSKCLILVVGVSLVVSGCRTPPLLAIDAYVVDVASHPFDMAPT